MGRPVLVKNPKWWGLKDPPIDIDEVVFSRIENPATRMSALLAGDLDRVYNGPPQDIEQIEKHPAGKVSQTPELRTLLLGMGQSRDELLASNVNGENTLEAN